MQASDKLINPEELKPARDAALRILEQLDKILLGRRELHEQILIAVLARGHVLLEGMPGTGKTELIKALGQVLALDFKRVQFTPDLMPSDIVGAHILQENESGRREMQFKQGPVFTHILLADEINRASPKTQAALLEAMQEKCVTLLGTTRKLPDPFFVLASQNPVDLEGTYPLPEAQLDRFLFKLNVLGLDVDVMTQIISNRRRGEPPVVDWTLSREALNGLFGVMDRIFIPAQVCRYISRLTAATHASSAEAPELVKRYVSFGASPRAAIAMAEAARARALLDGRPTVGFDDVDKVAPPVLSHRLILNYQARIDKIGPAELCAQLLERIDETELNLPKGVELSGGRK